jgi:cytochrome c peroxidase
MKHLLRGFATVGTLLAISSFAAEEEATQQTKLEDLGRALFFDVNLSQQRTQSCATCHDPALAFVDWRAFVPAGASPVGSAPATHLPGAASMGGDQHSLGDRNAPTASYAAYIPPLTLDAQNDYVGGLFWGWTREYARRPGRRSGTELHRNGDG